MRNSHFFRVILIASIFFSSVTSADTSNFTPPNTLTSAQVVTQIFATLPWLRHDEISTPQYSHIALSHFMLDRANMSMSDGLIQFPINMDKSKLSTATMEIVLDNSINKNGVDEVHFAHQHNGEIILSAKALSNRPPQKKWEPIVLE